MKLGLARRGYSAWGGAEAYLRRFAKALIEEGHSPILLGIDEWPAGTWPGKQVVYLPGESPRAFADALEKKAREAGCDRIFSMERVWKCDVYRAGDGVHRAWLERRGAHEPAWRSKFRRLLPKHRQMLKIEESLYSPEGARTIVANSRMVKDEIVRFYGYPEERIHIVYNGLPEKHRKRPHNPEDRARLRKEWGVTEDDYVILFAGSGWERKGLAFAIEALKEVKGKKPLLIVAGKGKPNRYPAPSNVRFVGPVTGIHAYYAAADVMILPTIYDPFSNACLEALTAGLPVITSRANGFAEVIQSGVEGEAVEAPSDPSALARAIEAWSSPERREAIRPRLIEIASRFTIEENVQQTLRLLLNTERATPPGVPLNRR